MLRWVCCLVSCCVVVWTGLLATPAPGAAQSPSQNGGVANDPNGDPQKWEPVVIRGQQRAPEFLDVAEWINTDRPLKMSDLRGRVTLVHFFAFGCINCIRNYPWYKSMHTEFKDRDFAIIGIHTPETEAEKQPANVRRAVQQAGIPYPIAIDNNATLWKLYYNQYWPATYLIDKKGFARYGWSGEVNWKGAQLDVKLRQKVLELLAEQ